MAQAQLHTRSVEILFGRAVAHSLRPLCAATVGCMERHPMNESGEPNMGNPSVRFDEGRERVGHWPVCLSIHPFPPTLQHANGWCSKLAERKNNRQRSA